MCISRKLQGEKRPPAIYCLVCYIGVCTTSPLSMPSTCTSFRPAPHLLLRISSLLALGSVTCRPAVLESCGSVLEMPALGSRLDLLRWSMHWTTSPGELSAHESLWSSVLVGYLECPLKHLVWMGRMWGQNTPVILSKELRHGNPLLRSEILS